MHRRFLFPLAAGVLGLVAISPVLAAEQSPPEKGSAPAKATTTTTSADSASDSATDPNSDPGTDPDAGTDSGSGPDSGSNNGKGGSNGTTPPKSGSDSGSSGSGSDSPGRSSSVCDPPEINKGPAPQVGDPAQTHEAGEAGSVDVERLSETELRIVKATANDGWTEQVAVPSGPRVTVKFTRQGESPTLIRFAASMDQRGTMIHTRVTSCG